MLLKLLAYVILNKFLDTISNLRYFEQLLNSLKICKFVENFCIKNYFANL